MQIMLEIPEALAGQARGEQELSRKVREALAVEGCLSGTLTRGQVAESLGMTFYEAEAWFVRKGLHRNYDPADLDSDQATLDRLFARR